jgi:hypothetical protein
VNHNETNNTANIKQVISSKWDDIPVEEDTRIIHRIEAALNDLDCVYETWFWDGVQAQSLIFIEEELTISLENMEKEIRENTTLLDYKDSDITTKVTNGYVFFNFNFEIS